MRAITNEKRELIIKHKNNGKTNKNIAEWLDISEREVSKIWELYQKQGSIENKYKNCGRKNPDVDNKMDNIIKKIHEQPDITLQEIIDVFNLEISQSALCRRLIKKKLTFKKRLSILQSKTEKMSKKSEKNLMNNRKH